MLKKCNVFRKTGVALLALFAMLLIGVGGVAPSPTSVQAASKTITVSTQSQLNKALKNGKYTKITIKNTKDASYKIAKGNYKAAIVVSAKAGSTFKLDIAKGTKITKGLTISGKNADIQISCAAKTSVTAKAASIIRLKAGAEGSTVKKTVAKGVYVCNYTKGNVKVTDKSGKTVTVKKAAAFNRKIELVVDDTKGVWISIVDNGGNLEIYKDAVFTVDGKNMTSDIYVSDIPGNDNWVRVSLKEALTEGSHTFTIEVPGYKMYTGKVVYESAVTGIVVGGPWIMEEYGIVLNLIPEVDSVKVTYTIDGSEIPPQQAFINGDGVLVVIFEDKLAPGEHTLVVSAEGYEAQTLTFTK